MTWEFSPFLFPQFGIYASVFGKVWTFFFLPCVPFKMCMLISYWCDARLILALIAANWDTRHTAGENNGFSRVFHYRIQRLTTNSWKTWEINVIIMKNNWWNRTMRWLYIIQKNLKFLYRATFPLSP